MILLSLGHVSNDLLYGVLAGAANAMMVYAMDWKCPRCGKSYHSFWAPITRFFNRCLHCGLQKWEIPPPTRVFD